MGEGEREREAIKGERGMRGKQREFSRSLYHVPIFTECVTDATSQLQDDFQRTMLIFVVVDENPMRQINERQP